LFGDEGIEIKDDDEDDDQRMEKRRQESQSDDFHIAMHFIYGFFDEVFEHMV